MHTTDIFKKNLASYSLEELQALSTDLAEVKTIAYSKMSAAAKRALTKEIMLTDIEIVVRKHNA